MHTTPPSRPLRRLGLLAAFVLAALALSPPAGAALASPFLTSPNDGVTVDALPPLKWDLVAGAHHYEFELSANAAFTSVVYTVTTTRNTRHAVRTVQPNGTYYWRVRGVTSGGDVGAWSEVRSLTLAWTAQPALLSPSNGAAITYPTDPLKLHWEAVPGAAKYSVQIASDLALGSLIWGPTSSPFETPATNYALNTPLAPGTYYWNVTPIDAEGHLGTPSSTASFTWVWPTEMTDPLTVTDLVPAAEVYDPELAWPSVPGAAGYELEINFAPAPDWPAGSQVCCDSLSFSTDATTLGTSYAPEVVLDNTHTYRWRVRAIDADGNAGVWNEGPSFTKPFDNVPPVTAPSVKNVHMRDNLADPATDTNLATSELDTATPVVVWDTVPGASGYEVNITRHNGVGCDWATGWTKETATTAWTPLGWSKVIGDGPWPSFGAPSTDLQGLNTGYAYCIRVRAVDRASTSSGPTVFGDWTYLNGNNQVAFRWDGPPASSVCAAPCQLASSDYVTPLTGTTSAKMPFFTWKPIDGAESYYVVVARDANYTSFVDYAFTRIPAYAPRKGTRSIGYPDDANLHWAVLPADADNGSGVYGDILESGGQTFAKQSAPPTLVSPVDDVAVNTAATVFRWNPVGEGVRRYRLQVSTSPTFSALLEDVATDATAYTSSTTYPSNNALYWRVRAEAEDGATTVALPWSASGLFRKQLPRPTWDGDNPTTGAGIPALTWSPVSGAISYDVEVREPDGDIREYGPFPTHAVSWREFTGVGITNARVRANFPRPSLRFTNGEPGPWSTDVWSYAHSMPAPSNPQEEVGKNKLLFTWDPRAAAEEYRIQVSSTSSFGSVSESGTSQTAAFAPLLRSFSFGDGGTFYWRVAMIDADRNEGDWSPTRSLTLPPVSEVFLRFRLGSTGRVVLNRKRLVKISVKDGASQPVGNASVRLSGPGVPLKTKKTNGDGKVGFYVKPTRLGKVEFRVTKSGFAPKYLYKKVRAS